MELEEGELKRKTDKIIATLDRLKARLTGQAAGIEHSINIERATYRALTLREQLAKHHKELDEAEEALSQQRFLIARQDALLIAIQKEMDEAFATEEAEMESNFANDQPQVVNPHSLPC